MRLALAALAAATLSISVSAQERSMQPPGMLRIFQEKIKEGRDGVHEAVEMKFAAALRKAKFPWGVVGMDAVFGPTEVWFVQPFESFADFRQHGAALWRDFQSAGQATEQADAEIILQPLDLLADGGRRYVQLLGRFLETQVATRRLEGAHGGKRR